jgi:uncharacterized membrane protein affecting hemolysin expression
LKGRSLKSGMVEADLISHLILLLSLLVILIISDTDHSISMVLAPIQQFSLLKHVLILQHQAVLNG